MLWENFLTPDFGSSASATHSFDPPDGLTIINTTAPMQTAMPRAIFQVIVSPNIRVPIRIAVRGSKTPRMEVLVGPMKRDEMASVSRESRVGAMASPSRLP